ncbi:MAG: hypothetical protein GXY87_07495 [Tissierellia bacterium]|nr:hypothetical protein [Tissierellia bacterium]
MKKINRLMVILALMLFALVACNNKPVSTDNEKPTTPKVEDKNEDDMVKEDPKDDKTPDDEGVLPNDDTKASDNANDLQPKPGPGQDNDSDLVIGDNNEVKVDEVLSKAIVMIVENDNKDIATAQVGEKGVFLIYPKGEFAETLNQLKTNPTDELKTKLNTYLERFATKAKEYHSSFRTDIVYHFVEENNPNEVLIKMENGEIKETFIR